MWFVLLNKLLNLKNNPTIIIILLAIIIVLYSYREIIILKLNQNKTNSEHNNIDDKPLKLMSQNGESFTGKMADLQVKTYQFKTN